MWQIFNFSLINFVLSSLYILGDFLNLVLSNTIWFSTIFSLLFSAFKAEFNSTTESFIASHSALCSYQFKTLSSLTSCVTFVMVFNLSVLRFSHQ